MAASDPSADGFRLVTFDLDGTLTSVHGWWVVARAVGREAEYRASNARFFAGAIGEDEHLADLVALAEGLSREEVDRLLASTPKVADLAESIAALRSRGIRSALLTHNPGFVCEWYQHRFGFDDYEGSDGIGFGSDGRIRRTAPPRADKVGGLARLVGRLGVSPGSVAHVGDGWADAAVFPRVGGGIAFNSRLPEVERAADVAVRSTSLRTVVRVVERLRPRAPVNGDGPAVEPSNR